MKPAQLSLSWIRLIGIIVTMVLIIGILLPSGIVKAASSVFGLPPPMSDDQAHITDGIIIGGCVIVVIIFTGVILSSRGTRRRQPQKPKQK